MRRDKGKGHILVLAVKCASALLIEHNLLRNNMERIFMKNIMDLVFK